MHAEVRVRATNEDLDPGADMVRVRVRVRDADLDQDLDQVLEVATLSAESCVLHYNWYCT